LKRVDACEELLWHSEACDGFVTRSVAEDETWIHCHQQETMRASKEWHHPSSPKLKKFRLQLSVRKVMLTLF
jgi:hypothetical protein